MVLSDELFDIHVLPGLSEILVVVCGELDVATAPQLERILHEHAGTSIVIDCSQVSFLDAFSIGVLVSAQARQRELGVTLRLEHLQSQVERVFKVADVYTQLCGETLWR